MASGSGLLRERTTLTHRKIEALPPDTAPYRVADQRCPGLAVRVSPNGLMTWDLAYRISGMGRVRRTSLGRFPDISLEAARQRASELTRAARAGVDLIAREAINQEAAASRITVRMLIEIYIRRRVAGRLRTAVEIERRLNRALSSILDRYADDLQRRDIRELLDRCADAGFQREAERRRQTISAMYRWALSQDYVGTNPTAGLAGYDIGTPRDRVLSADEITVLWDFLEEGGFPPNTTAILKLQLATGARVGEVSGLPVEEIDQVHWIWRLPAERSKNKRPRATPLVGIAKSILQDRLGAVSSGPLFVTEAGKAMTAADVGQSLIIRRRKLSMAHFTTHDLRRTVSNSMREMSVPMETVAAVIGHEVGGKAVRTLARHYSPGDLIEVKKRALLAWDKRLREIIDSGGPSGNVRLFRRSA
jgi:integrase